MNITVQDILNVTNGTIIYGNKDEVCENFARNTKEIKDGDVYIGFKGERFDGGKFYEEALNNGAKGCIINKIDGLEIKHIENKFIIQVEDTVEAVGKIAKFKREKYNIPVIAITGSVGKTSTKDIIYSVVSQKYNTLKTQGNLNNHIGMPMTILGLKDHKALVVEMGMNHFGELSKLTKIARPTIAVITNVGTAHIGNLGSRENILKAKLEILEGLTKEGYVVINNDNDLLHKWQTENTKFKVITYGINNQSMYVAKNIEYTDNGSKYELEAINCEKAKIDVPVGGEAFVYNSLAAISVGKILDIPMEKIQEGIRKFELSKMRLDVQKVQQGYTIINDCYNANYDSMKSAIEYLKNIEGKRKIAVLGDMLELGEFSKELHENVGKIVAENKIDILITVGEEAKNIAKIAEKNGVSHVYVYKNNQDAIDKLKKILAVEDVALIKASNSMNFKEIANALVEP
ncbi:MAG: UDP-N-acetylmuramoyl-tripeptide--D-alanyl-D-alanine ligase [Clostridia bacterium]